MSLIATASGRPAPPETVIARELPEAEAAEARERFLRVRLPANSSRFGHRPLDCLALVLDDVVSPEECAELRERGQETGLEYVLQARHDVDGESFMIAIANPRRYRLGVFEDAPFADVLWERLRARCAAPIEAFERRDGWAPARGLNRRLRVLQYASDKDEFPPHFDLVVAEDDAARHSLITVLLYLNDGGGADFSGGETLYLDHQRPSAGGVAVQPRAGRVVLFEHELWHAGSRLAEGETGSKFVLRTDVMFDIERPRAPEPGAGEEEDATVEAMLARLGLERLREPMDDYGLLGTMDALRGSGRRALRCMLAEMEGVTEADAARVVEVAFAGY